MEIRSEKINIYFDKSTKLPRITLPSFYSLYQGPS